MENKVERTNAEIQEGKKNWNKYCGTVDGILEHYVTDHQGTIEDHHGISPARSVSWHNEADQKDYSVMFCLSVTQEVSILIIYATSWHDEEGSRYLNQQDASRYATVSREDLEETVEKLVENLPRRTPIRIPLRLLRDAERPKDSQWARLAQD